VEREDDTDRDEELPDELLDMLRIAISLMHLTPTLCEELESGSDFGALLTTDAQRHGLPKPCCDLTRPTFRGPLHIKWPHGRTQYRRKRFEHGSDMATVVFRFENQGSPFQVRVCNLYGMCVHDASSVCVYEMCTHQVCVHRVCAWNEYTSSVCAWNVYTLSVYAWNGYTSSVYAWNGYTSSVYAWNGYTSSVCMEWVHIKCVCMEWVHIKCVCASSVCMKCVPITCACASVRQCKCQHVCR
jgi:hypothetical protein